MSANFWETYNFRLEPWATEYDSPVNLVPADEESETPVNLHVETEHWLPCKPEVQPELPEQIIFVDGRRRLDGRFLGKDNGEILYGAFATIAVGAVQVNQTTKTARCLPPQIGRVIAIGGNRTAPVTPIPCPLGTSSKLIYHPCDSAADNEPQTPLRLIQKLMLQREALLAVQLSAQTNAFVIRDGPLLYSPYKAPGSTLGYVKTMGKTYLRGEAAALLWQLNLGERTPLFILGEPGSQKSHWSWYLRSGQANLSPRRLGYHDLHGIVRLDLYGEVPLEKAKAIADLSTHLIPKYASHPIRDPRAPQNLTPVGALERELARYMGDRALIERRLRSFLAL